MAIVKNNPYTQGLKGTIGNILFRQVNGKTVASLVPKKPKKARPQSAAQRATRDHFREAALFGKAVQDDPELKAYYLRKAKKMNLTNAYVAAVKEYMNKPDISTIKISANQVKVVARKENFDTGKVEITLLDKAGKVIAHGPACHKKNDSQRHRWYLNVIPEIAACAATVRVVVEDRAGNVVTRHQPVTLEAPRAKGMPLPQAA